MNTTRQTIEKMIASMDKEFKDTIEITNNSNPMSNFKAEIIGEAAGFFSVIEKVKGLLKQNDFVNTFHINELAKINAQTIKDKQDKVKPPQIEMFKDELYKEGYAKGFYYGLDKGCGYIGALIRLEADRENVRKQKQQTQQQQTINTARNV
jgi:hypothetical protein